MKTFAEEVKKVIDDAERLSNEEWVIKYGDRPYMEVLKSLILQRIESCDTHSVCITRSVTGGLWCTHAKVVSDLYRAFGLGKEK